MNNRTQVSILITLTLFMIVEAIMAGHNIQAGFHIMAIFSCIGIGFGLAALIKKQ